MPGIEGKQWSFDLFYNPLKQGCCFDGTRAPNGKQVGEFVDFRGEPAEGIVRGSIANSKRIIFFPESSNNVRKSLQRPGDVFVESDNKQPTKASSVCRQARAHPLPCGCYDGVHSGRKASHTPLSCYLI